MRRWEVTFEPEEEIWENTAPMSAPLVLEAEVPLGGIGGGGGALSKFGRGGGGGGPEEVDGLGAWPDWTSRRASAGSMPSLFQVTPLGQCCFT